MLSIVVTVFNKAKYLEQCINSILSQTYQDIEVICIDDGSTDNSNEILKRFECSKLKIFRQSNMGLGAARNVGIRLARGEFITFVDADDYLEKNTYELSIKKIGNADLLCFGIKTFGTENKAILNNDKRYYKIRFNGIKKIKDNVILETDVSACNKIFRTSIIKKYQIYFPENIFYEDNVFFYEYTNSINSIFYLKKYLYNYRRAEDTIMGKSFLKEGRAIDHLKIVEILGDFYKKNDLILQKTYILTEIFRRGLMFSYVSTPKSKLDMVYKYATYLAKKLVSEGYSNEYIYKISQGNFREAFEPNYTFLEKIFSIRRVLYIYSPGYLHVVYFLFMKFYKKNRYSILIYKLNENKTALKTAISLLEEINSSLKNQ